MEVLIVAKTHMNKGSCVGAYSFDKAENYRLLTDTGGKLPENIEYEVGDIWEISFERRLDITKPHVEDVLVKTKKFVRRQTGLESFLMQTVPIWEGNPHNIFQGKALFPHAQSCYIENRNDLPSQSVGFWLPDRNLELTILPDRRHYFYFGEDEVCVFPYVGYRSTIETIPKSTIVRVSLTRWWSPNSGISKKCYCQISGWYD